MVDMQNISDFYNLIMDDEDDELLCGGDMDMMHRLYLHKTQLRINDKLERNKRSKYCSSVSPLTMEEKEELRLDKLKLKIESILGEK